MAPMIINSIIVGGKVDIRTGYAWDWLSSQCFFQNRLKGIGLTHESKIVGVGAVGGSLGVVSKKCITFKVVEVFHAGGYEAVESSNQLRATSGVMVAARCEEPGVGEKRDWLPNTGRINMIFL